MSMSKFFQNFLTLPHHRHAPMVVKEKSCHETRETEHEDNDSNIQKSTVVSSDDECDSIASSNTEICGEIDYQDFEICDEEIVKVVKKGDVNDLPPAECDGPFVVNHSLCKVPPVQSVSTEQIVESSKDKQKYLIQEPSDQGCKTTSVSGEEFKSRPILLVPIDHCGKGKKEICIEKSTIAVDSSVTSMLPEEVLATKENYLPSMPYSSNTAFLNTSEWPNKTIDHCIGETQKQPMKTNESYSNGITDRRQLPRKANGQENIKTYVHAFQLKSQVKLNYCSDETQTETAQELVLPSSNSTAVADQLSDNEGHVESNSHPLQLENSRLKEKLILPIMSNGFVTASRIVGEDELLSPEGSQCSTTTQTLLSSENANYTKEVLHHAANDRSPTSSLSRDARSFLSSKLPPGSTKFNSLGVFRTRDKEKPFMCGFCGKTSDKYHTLNQHITVQHKTLEKRYVCEICGSRFAQPWHLASHAKHHAQERPFTCDQCGRRFKSQAVLRRHAAAHTKDRPFSCKICHKSFESQSYLLFEHSKVHKEEKGSIICNICKKVFNHSFHLSRHMTVHSGEKLLKCTFCDLHFRRDIHLRQHMITHEETKELLQGDAQDAEKIINVPIQLVTSSDKPKFLQCSSKGELKTGQVSILSSNCITAVKVLQENASFAKISILPFQLENSEGLIEPSFTMASTRLSMTDPNSAPSCTKSQVVGTPKNLPYDSENKVVSGSKLTIVGEPRTSNILDPISNQSQRRGYVTRAVDRKRVSLASGIVYEDEVSTLESLHYSTTTQTLLLGAWKEHLLSSSRQSVNDDGKSSSFRKHVQSVVTSKRSSDDALRRSQHIVYTKGKEKPFSCGICGKAYNLKHSVYGHIMFKHEEKRYSCEFCGKPFAQPSGLAMHVRIHTPEKPFTCDQCGKQFRRDSELRSHKYTHSEERLFSCDKCSKSFKFRGALSRHKESHQTVEQRKGVACDICKRKFGKPSLLKEHVRIHTGEKPFKCTLCEKQFRKKIQLRNHMNSHSGKKKLAKDPCSVCGKTFWANHMPDHMRMHAGVKPYECNICGKRFPKRANLEGHMRSHTGEKPFACDRCDKRFALYSNMVTHKAKCTVLLKTLA